MTPEEIQAEVQRRIAAKLASLSDAQRVDAANGVPREKLLPPNYKKHEKTHVAAYRVNDLPDELSAWTFDLVKRNMEKT